MERYYENKMDGSYTEIKIMFKLANSFHQVISGTGKQIYHSIFPRS